MRYDMMITTLSHTNHMLQLCFLSLSLSPSLFWQMTQKPFKVACECGPAKKEKASTLYDEGMQIAPPRLKKGTNSRSRLEHVKSDTWLMHSPPQLHVCKKHLDLLNSGSTSHCALNQIETGDHLCFSYHGMISEGWEQLWQPSGCCHAGSGTHSHQLSQPADTAKLSDFMATQFLTYFSTPLGTHLHLGKRGTHWSLALETFLPLSGRKMHSPQDSARQALEPSYTM